MAKLFLNDLAEQDLLNITRYGVENFGIEAARLYYDALFSRFIEIAERPLIYPAVDDIKQGYRRCVHQSHSIDYRQSDAGVEIMRIIGRQKCRNWVLVSHPSSRRIADQTHHDPSSVFTIK